MQIIPIMPIETMYGMVNRRAVTKTEKGWLDNWDVILKIVNFWHFFNVLWVNLFQYKTRGKPRKRGAASPKLGR